ncbi:MAG: hypothetical protein LBH45_03485 [Campylobacteraceae bacterium]|jgi:hypothetical protein|nr:hypothetical protein [Campylobacteraceae bacterium]
MKKEITIKITWAEVLIKKGIVTKKDLDDLKRWISYFQHERLIHLIVTVFVGLLDMISFIMLFLASGYTVFVLNALLSILFIFYIMHYYALENGTQKLYRLLDEMIKLYNSK